MRMRLLPLLALLLALAVSASACGTQVTAEESAANSKTKAPGEAAEEPAEAEEPASGAAGDPQKLAEEVLKRTKPKVEVATGDAPAELETDDLIEGTGPAVKEGDQIGVNYVGVLYKNGEEFDTSFGRGQPFIFPLGAGQVIPGWDEGLQGMKVGGRRQLTIPSDLAYGATGSPPKIGPDEPLVFVIDLIGIAQPAG